MAWFECILCEYSLSFNILFIFILGMTQATSDLIVMVALGKPSIKEVKMDQLQKLQKLQNLQPWPFTRQGQDDAH